MNRSVLSSILGYPRIGEQRELKWALEKYWKKKLERSQLEETARSLRKQHWQTQEKAGIDYIPSHDFSYYDLVLDHAFLFNMIPQRIARLSLDSFDQYFAAARGYQQGEEDVYAMEMSKWFNTNYHYVVPEVGDQTQFKLNHNRPLEHYLEAKKLNLETRPVILGPVTLLSLSKKEKVDDEQPLKHLDRLIPLYCELFKTLSDHGVEWIQLDEPILAYDHCEMSELVFSTLQQIGQKTKIKILLTSYYGGVHFNEEQLQTLPVEGLHIDLVSDQTQLKKVDQFFPSNKVLSLGIIDGRGIWTADLNKKLSLLKDLDRSNRQLIVSSSCSLLHVPYNAQLETIDSQTVSYLSFAKQKLSEIVLIARAMRGEEVSPILKENQRLIADRQHISSLYVEKVRTRHQQAMNEASKRNPVAKRLKLQKEVYQLPPLATTTIGSLPQTLDVRKARADHRKGLIGQEEYRSFLKKKISEGIQLQEEIGLDVLIHGEYERNDMVEYFGELLEGYVFTRHGWVQSYGSRCVKPPIIYGDVHRKQPMTVEWIKYAQSLTDKPVKAMLTGPITILNWSFVRDDLPRKEVCEQLALAIRDEVLDLEKAGITMIQIDEPAFREGLPLLPEKRAAYLKWSVECFRLTTNKVKDSTQIHTHMCYSEFNSIIDSVTALDADVITIEAARSRMELLDAFIDHHYPSEIGPGIWDIHSPRVPSVEEMVLLLEKALDRLSPDQLWVNPDCGLKTRDLFETKKSLENMIKAAQILRKKYT